ncbi:rhomboid family intramembrane serine protease [Hymenobacter sp. BT559]|jgi:membrane associated rhomboid family serine protease|uniref:rhomboid family intramembrane serine protease n=1 Tax=Hymenobacter sp. BT559 TaxID=2795729 RepID=UPI0018ED45D7|nr:rhomboid family intramembrane serine protease [Hymenobacter sp. BT559]MBJ6142167.1 rhomboid family intramembrane serine protease [Hymenobacter sp. BT559]
MSLTQDIRDAFSRRDNALNQLIIINALVFAVLIILRAIFFIAQSSSYQLVMRQLALPSDFYSLLRHPWTLLTYAFVHEGFLHILFNMLNLYWFGQLIREYLGDRRLVSLYILGALVGAAFFLLAYNFIPALQPFVGQPVIGASASVTAVIVAAATLLPDFTFMLFIIGAVKIKWIAVAVVLISIAGINGGNPGGEITHLGGALLGFVFIKQLKAGRDMGTPVTAVGNWFSRLFSQGPSMRVTHRQPVTTGARSASSSSKSSASAVAGQDEIDLILDKISHSGYESLSKDEKQKLFRASQQ